MLIRLRPQARRRMAPDGQAEMPSVPAPPEESDGVVVAVSVVVLRRLAGCDVGFAASEVSGAGLVTVTPAVPLTLPLARSR